MLKGQLANLENRLKWFYGQTTMVKRSSLWKGTKLLCCDRCDQSLRMQTADSKVHRNSKSRRISDVKSLFLKLVSARKSQETARPKRKMAYFNLEISKMWVNSTLKNWVCRCLPIHLFTYTCSCYTFLQCPDNLTQSCTGESSSKGILK